MKTIELILHSIGAISLGTALGALFNLMNFTGYHAGYTVGAFFMLYYWVGMSLIDFLELEELRNKNHD